MNFQELHELLRLELLRRIEAGQLTGTELARQVDFRQGHVSNFLNRKRSLSLDGLDRVLAAQRLTVEQLMPLELSAASAETTELSDALHEPAGPIAVIPVVSATAAMKDAVVREGSEIDVVRIAASRLQGSHARASAKQARWQRFVAVRADEQQSAAMEPMIAAGATVVLDRHYNSLAPYRAHQKNLLAVRCGGALALRFVEFDDGTLVLRPLSDVFPVQLIALEEYESPADYIVGRVCMVMSDFNGGAVVTRA